MTDATEALRLKIAGRVYETWTSAEVTRRLDHMAAHFRIAATEGWAAGSKPWQVAKFDACEIWVGEDLLLSGYVDDYAPGFDGHAHRVEIVGRSRTADLLDCTPELHSGQFNGYTLDAIARTIAALFAIDVIVETPAAQVLVDATLERCETAYQFIDRLCRLSGVLATDDAAGRLVLTTAAGAGRAASRLVQGEGQNVMAARAAFKGEKQFSDYIVRGQAGVGADLGLAGFGGVGGGAAPAVNVDQVARAHDASVPRYRPHMTLAESRLDARGMQLRADWQRAFAFGRSVSAHVRVRGWRQVDGSLWRTNQLVPTTIPFLKLDRDLLVVETKFALSPTGRSTDLTLGPVEGFTPDPGSVKLRKHKGAHDSGAFAAGFGGT